MTGRPLLLIFLLVGFAAAQSSPDVPIPSLNAASAGHLPADEQEAQASQAGAFALAPDDENLDRVLKRAPESHREPMDVLVSVADLKVPPKAAKEFRHANRLIEKQDWKEALEHLHKVLAIDPGYPAAYNNLALVYSHLANSAEAAAALRKAIELDQHFIAAYMNLGRLSITMGDYRGAESLFAKAATLSPPDAFTLDLLAYSQLLAEHFDQAIATCNRGHKMLPPQHGFLHLVAAHAYVQTRRTENALAELRAYLQEEPNGPRAPEVRASIAKLQGAPLTSAAR